MTRYFEEIRQDDSLGDDYHKQTFRYRYISEFVSLAVCKANW